jgi:hypothetical protein
MYHPNKQKPLLFLTIHTAEEIVGIVGVSAIRVVHTLDLKYSLFLYSYTDILIIAALSVCACVRVCDCYLPRRPLK